MAYDDDEATGLETQMRERDSRSECKSGAQNESGENERVFGV